VDDDVPIRTSLSLIFTGFGHRVRSSADGFSTLLELQQELPEIILSDLNMPGMSGFELLSVVRRRFPAIQVIAMSGAFSGDGVPPGVAADAFYEKGTSLRSLLQIVEAMTQSESPSLQHPSISCNRYAAALRPNSTISVMGFGNLYQVVEHRLCRPTEG
jgi:CheY-like chemotaxis protein